ncbi:MAG: hypothetical protein ACREEP_15365 [Dongiaceae bacterium]
MLSRKSSCVALAAILALPALVAFTPVAVAGNVNAVDDDTPTALTTSPKRLQPEPTIAIDPANPKIIAAGAQDFRKTTELNEACTGNRWNGLYISYDGGKTWEQSLVPGYFTDPAFPQGTEQDESEQFGLCLNTDPVIVFDGLGNFYYSHISFNDIPEGTSTPSTVGVLYVSTYRFNAVTKKYAHAKTVKIPSASGLNKAREKHEVGPGNSNFDDKEWMTVDRSPASPHYGRAYVTWTKFGAQGGQSSVWVSHCGGDVPGESCADDEGWSDGVVVNKPVAGGLVQESYPATAPDGTLYVGFLQFQGGFGSTRPHAGVWIARSLDGGANFTQKQITDIRQIPSPIPPQGGAANDGSNSFRTGTAVGVAVTSNAQSSGHSVHVVWGEWIDEAQADVRYSRSIDGGATWATPLRLNDVATGHQFFPSIAANGNVVHVAWLDSRLNADLSQAITDLQVVRTRFSDGGAAAATDIIVTDQPFDPNQVSRFPVFCQAFIGDYIDIDVVPTSATKEKIAVIWSDNSNVGVPLTPAECAAFRAAPADDANQPRLNDGSLDQDAFADIKP